MIHALVTWLAAHCVTLESMAILVLTYIIAIQINKAYIRKLGDDTKRVSYMKLLAFPTGAALCCLYCMWLSNGVKGQSWLASLLQSLRYTIHTFALENTMRDVWEDARLTAEQFAWWEEAYFSLLLLLAPLSTASIVLSFFKTPRFWLRFYIDQDVPVYFFSDLNERAATYARTLQHKGIILNGKGKAKKPLMVFCLDEEKPDSGDIDALNIPGAVILRNSICQIPMIRAAKMDRVHLYLVTDDENKKLHQAQRLLEKYHGTGCHIRCISAQQTNDHEIDALNQQYSFWDEKGAASCIKKNCRLLVISDPAPVELPTTVTPWLTIICGADDAKPTTAEQIRTRRLYLKRSVCQLAFCKWLTGRTWVTFLLNSTERSQCYHEAQQLNELRKGRRSQILRLDIKTEKASEVKPEHAVCFDASGTEQDKPNREEAQRIRSNFIDLLEEASNLVYANLHKTCLINKDFLEAFYRDYDWSGKNTEKRPMRVLILGGGAIGEELARICLWYCQLPGMKAEVTVAGKEQREQILGRVLKDHVKTPPESGDGPYYIDEEKNATLIVKGSIDFRTKELEILLGKSEADNAGYHAIFVCSGDDDQNYRIALRLRRYYLRNEPAWGCPQIRVNIWNDSMSELLQHSSALNGSKDFLYNLSVASKKDTPSARYNPECSISIFGTMQESILCDDAVRFDALRYHAHYCATPHEHLIPTENKTLSIPLDDYHSFHGGTESDRRSNMAVAIHGKCKYAWSRYIGSQTIPVPEQSSEGIGEKYSNVIRALGETEHRRWCIFKLLEGSCAVPSHYLLRLFNFKDKPNTKTRDLDNIRGYHAIIRPWADLVAQAKAEHEQSHGSKWQSAERENYELAQFSIDLETVRDPDLQKKKGTDDDHTD